jgi:hypothetical protein
MYRRLAIEQPAPAPALLPTSAVLTEVTPSPVIMKDSLLLSDDDDDDNDDDDDDDDDDGPDSEIERITNVKDENESSRPLTPRVGGEVKSPFSQLFSAQSVPVRKTGGVTSKNKSDSDDDDEFIAMLKRK